MKPKCLKLLFETRLLAKTYQEKYHPYVTCSTYACTTCKGFHLTKTGYSKQLVSNVTTLLGQGKGKLVKHKSRYVKKYNIMWNGVWYNVTFNRKTKKITSLTESK